MNAHHEPTTPKPIADIAMYKRNLIPANISHKYALKPIFASIAPENDIRNGVIAFRNFLYLFFDRLISDGQFAKPKIMQNGMTDYPFFHSITNMLVEMGYYSRLSQNSNSLLITEMPSCTATIDNNGKKKPPKISLSGQKECLQFLTLCGFVFIGNVTEIQYPSNPQLLVGLKVLSIADMELRPERRGWNDNNLLRCDYRLLKSDDTDILDILKDILHPLPQNVQEFAINLHKRYTNAGLTCTQTILADTSFFYAKLTGRKYASVRDMYAQRVFEFSYSLKFGYSLFVRAKKTEKYADIIATFPQFLQDKITNGYGCDRKRGERCQGSCQGIRIPLDETILDISNHIIAWLDYEK